MALCPCTHIKKYHHIRDCMPMNVMNIIEYLALIVSEFANYETVSRIKHPDRCGRLIIV